MGKEKATMVERTDTGPGGKAVKKTSATDFIKQVRQEGSKVTWPSRKETAVTTGMVFVMVLLAAVFFLAVDQLLNLGVRLVLGLGA